MCYYPIIAVCELDFVIVFGLRKLLHVISFKYKTIGTIISSNYSARMLSNVKATFR